MKQKQFLEVLDRDEAERRWREVVGGAPLSAERVSLETALGRVLAEDVRAEVDVPGFDRSNMDGFAVHAVDTFGASEEEPVRLRLNDEILATGIEPRIEVAEGTATLIATGGMLPRGADAVAPIEITDTDADDPGLVWVRAPRVPGAAVSFAGTDMGSVDPVAEDSTCGSCHSARAMDPVATATSHRRQGKKQIELPFEIRSRRALSEPFPARDPVRFHRRCR